MGSFYSGFGGHKSHLGHCEDGIIYSGRTPIGRYENGNIYNQFKEYVGSYGGGSIYNQFHEHIASYDNGIVYNKYLNAVVGREQVGSYDGNPAEAAALVLLFLGGDNINTRSGTTAEENTTTSRTTTYSSSGDSDTGCLSCLIFLAIGGLLKLLWPIIEIIIFYYIIPVFSSMTWFVFVHMLFGATGLVPLLFVGAIVIGICFTTFIPYWFSLVKYRVKKQITTQQVLSYYGKWFLKGPFAYKEIRVLKESFKNK